MYTSKTQIENYLLTTIDASFSEQVEAWIASAQKFIDTYTGRTFEAVEASKRYDGNGRDTLRVYDLLEVDSITIAPDPVSEDGTVLAETDYVLENFNELDPERLPFNVIRLNPYGKQGAFPRGLRNIIVEGTWGYSETAPADIAMVATKLVASIIKTGKDGQTKSFTQADYSVTYEDFGSMLDKDVSLKGTLDMYKRPATLSGYGIIRV